MTQQIKIIDGDGHIFEDSEAIARHFPYGRRGSIEERGVSAQQPYSIFTNPHSAEAGTPVNPRGELLQLPAGQTPSFPYIY